MPSHQCPPNASGPRAFTLIELLVVVSIISILASIAVPNFLDAQVRAKVGRTKADMRTIMMGIETYRIDNNKGPVRHNSQARKNPNYDPNETNPYSQRYGEYSYVPAIPEISNSSDAHIKMTQLARLTTPIAYLGSLPADVFNLKNNYPDNTLDYWDEYQTMWFVNSWMFMSMLDPGLAINKPGAGSYMLVSVGPDGFLGLGQSNSSTAKQYGWAYTDDKSVKNSMYSPYDPSNGAVSAGNIYDAPDLGGMDGTAQNLQKRFIIPQ